MKRKIYLVLCLILAVVYMNGCSKSTNINLVSREEGSGTRSAFIEMVGLLEKSSKGNLEDLTSQEAIIQNSTEAIINTVAGDKNSIGYISLGSLNHRVKALKINDIPVSAENIKNNSYQIARPFNIVFKKDLKPLTQDFIDFILSQDGQNIINNEAYIPVDIKNHNYSPSQNQGSLVIAGSTSIYPVMEKLAERYQVLNPNISVEIQSTGSTAGIQATKENSADIGMVSRQLNEFEREDLLYETIALDGIAIIVNKENPIDNLNLEELKSIYTGDIISWDQLK